MTSQQPPLSGWRLDTDSMLHVVQAELERKRQLKGEWLANQTRLAETSDKID